jgi:hypothetical protein
MLKWAAPAALLAAFFLQSFLASRLKSPVFDEPAHIAAGLSYVSRGVFHANLQHPPLMKELSAIGMLAGGVRWPNSPTANDILATLADPKTPGRDWDVGGEILATYGYDRTLALARFPMMLVGVLLGTLLYLWGREMLGQTAALGALFLFALDPTFIAHSALVTTDVGLAAFSLAFCFALWKYIQAPTLQRQIWCGVALGCALGAKYSALFLLPIGAALLWFATTRRKSAQPPFAQTVRAFGVMCLIALLMVELFYGFRASPLTYLDGIHRVNADHDPNYMAVFGGEAQKRFPLYFVGAWLLKEPLATIVLCLAGAVVLLRKKDASVTKAFVLLPPIVLFAVHSLWAENIGVRYVLAAMPFLYLAGGAAIAWLLGSTAAWARVAAVALGAWAVVAAAGIYPDHLSYFNESACVLTNPSLLGLDGGSRCGPLWLDDSNVDWGQGLKQLKIWLDANANGRAVHLMPFSSTPPSRYGIVATPPPAERGPEPALYIFSGHFLSRLAITDPNVRRTPPLAVVGHAFYVYP